MQTFYSVLWGFPFKIAQGRPTVLAEFCQSGPVFVLTSTRRTLSFFIGFLPALHLTGLSHCKMRKNSSDIIVVFQKIWIPLLYLFTYWKREGESEERDGTFLGNLG